MDAFHKGQYSKKIWRNNWINQTCDSWCQLMKVDDMIQYLCILASPNPIVGLVTKVQGSAGWEEETWRNNHDNHEASQLIEGRSWYRSKFRYVEVTANELTSTIHFYISRPFGTSVLKKYWRELLTLASPSPGLWVKIHRWRNPTSNNIFSQERTKWTKWYGSMAFCCWNGTLSEDFVCITHACLFGWFQWIERLCIFFQYFFWWPSNLAYHKTGTILPFAICIFFLLCCNACRLRVSICPNTGTRMGWMSNCVMHTFTQFNGTLTIANSWAKPMNFRWSVCHWTAKRQSTYWNLHCWKLFELNRRCLVYFGAIGKESSWPLQGKQDVKWHLAAQQCSSNCQNSVCTICCQAFKRE